MQSLCFSCEVDQADANACEYEGLWEFDLGCFCNLRISFLLLVIFALVRIDIILALLYFELQVEELLQMPQ